MQAQIPLLCLSNTCIISYSYGMNTHCNFATQQIEDSFSSSDTQYHNVYFFFKNFYTAILKGP